MRTRLSLLPLLACGLTTAIGAQTTETMPNPLPASYGGNVFPFGSTSPNSEHVQFVYDASHISFTGPVLIQRLRFRSTGACTGGSATNVTIKLSQCPLAWDKISQTYAANLTPAKTVTVLNNGTANFTASAAAGWCFDLQLTTPYLFDTTKGPLVFDWERLSTGTLTGGFTGGMAGTAANPLKGSRTYGPSGQANAAGTTINANGYACAAEITWIPASGLYSSFTATPTEGKSPLVVQFTDTTYSSAGPVKTWAWDFDADQKVDSTAQNPKWTFSGTGWDQFFDVTLTTTDGTHKPSTVTMKKFIRVNPSTATAVDFGVGSTNKPAPTPIAVSPFSSIYSAAAGIRGYYFVAPTNFLVTGFEAPNDYTPKEADQTIVCYVLSQPPTGAFNATAADVKYFATGKAGTILRPTPPIAVKQGEWFGVLGACHASTPASLFRNSYGAGPFPSAVLGKPITLQRLWMNSDARTNQGLGTVNPSSGTLSRVWVHVAGNFAVPTLTTIDLPKLGTTPKLSMRAMFTGAQAGVLFMGLGRMPAPVPTPFGDLLIQPPFYLTLLVPNGTADVPLGVPNDPMLTGLLIDWQGVAFDFTNATYGTTNGTEWFVGL